MNTVVQPSLSASMQDLMRTSGVKFGTSGARGLVSAMTDLVCYAYTTAFLQYLESQAICRAGDSVAVGGDLRPSTPRIARAAAKAASDRGYRVINAGDVPSPALALFGLQQRCPTVMVTGSHIPADRNGIKFNTPTGEILKQDEQGIVAQTVTIPPLFREDGSFVDAQAFQLPSVDEGAVKGYVSRWTSAFPASALQGRRLGVYGHSAVGREIMVEVLSSLGAEVVRLGWSETFVPVDTEAIRTEDVELAAKWARESHFDAIVSADGDSDRPLISDERGRWLRGDVAGVICSQFLKADCVATPVSCNTMVEKTREFPQVIRTRIGSPFVIEAMISAVARGAARVVGYEANGGFLTASDIVLPFGTILPALPTRDPIVVQLAVLCLSAQLGLSISQLIDRLPARATASDRVCNFPWEVSGKRISELAKGGSLAIQKAFPGYGSVVAVDQTDGLRIEFDSQEIVHIRASGNAPELRCYTEAASQRRACDINAEVIAVLRGWI